MCSAAFSAPSPLPDSWLCSLHLPLFFNLSSPSSSGTHCGYMIPPIMVSASDTLSVTFKSDSRLTDRGFSAKWQAVYPEDITGTHTNTGSTLTPEAHIVLMLQQLNASLRRTIKHLTLSHLEKAAKSSHEQCELTGQSTVWSIKSKIKLLYLFLYPDYQACVIVVKVLDLK